MIETSRVNANIGVQHQDAPEWVDADFARQLERELREALSIAESMTKACDSYAEENQRLSDELAEARKDAERYRWLRADTRGDVYNGYSIPEELDAAIDAAINASGS